MTPYPFPYLAYGSNLHPERLRNRLDQVRLLGTVRLSGYRLMFHKRSNDGSGKCSLLPTDEPTSVVHGALFVIARKDKARLDLIEGLGKGYKEELMDVSLSGKSEKAFAYVAESKHVDGNLRPYTWYHELVLAGAEYHGFPQEYIRNIGSVLSQKDPDPNRAKKQAELVSQVRMASL